MKSMGLFFVIFGCISLLLIKNVNAQILVYDIKVVTDHQLKQLTVESEIKIKTLKTDDYDLLLNGAVQNLSITSGGKPVSFAHLNQSPNQFINGRLLNIKGLQPNAINTLSFKYQLPVSAINYWDPDHMQFGVKITDGLETGMYSAWLPLPLNNGNFSYQLTVDTPANFKVVGNGNILNQGNQWTVTSNQPQFDVPLLISNKIQTETIVSEAGTVELVHFGLPLERVNKLANNINEITALFSAKFGPVASAGKYQFAFVPRNNNPSYSRKGFAVINNYGSEVTRFSTLAHEIAHFWWNGADSASWEDWLNESFAEYAALIAIEEEFGDDVHTKTTTNFAKVASQAPAIWQLARDHEQSTLSLYRKGPLILEQLKQKIGEDDFYQFLRELNLNKIKTTSAALDHLKSSVSSEAELQLRQSLQQ